MVDWLYSEEGSETTWERKFSNVVDPLVRENGVIYCALVLKVKEMGSIAQATLGNRRAMPTEALHHVQFFNFCNQYIREIIVRIQNRA